MHIGGALGIIGSSTLQAYTWGATVVGIVNTHLPKDQQVSIRDTGNTVLERILDLDDHIQDAVLALEIGVVEGYGNHVDPNQKTRSAIFIALAIILLVVALVVTGAFSSVGVGGGQLPDSGTLETLFNFLLEAFKLLLGGTA